ncbi:MAG: diguanylate cyclase [Myxococcota bacterium]|nr:diguanylate cyclase [Myxococcota bacterium]
MVETVNSSETGSRAADPIAPEPSADHLNLMALVQQLEDQQKMIGALQVKLHHMEEKAANLDNRVFQMRALLQSGKGFSQILELHSLLEAFMEVCRERYSAINSSVLLLDDLDPESVYYRVRAYCGLPDTFTDKQSVEEEMFMFKIPHNQGLLWQLIHQGDVFAVRDMRKLPRFESAFNRWNLSVLQSDVWVPLLRGSDVLGVLTLGECEDGSQIPETDYAFLEEIAAVAATVIDSTLKYEKNGRILNNLRTLYDVNQQLANVNDFRKLMIETLASAVEALKAQKANLMLYNHQTERLEIKAVWGNIPPETLKAINEGILDTKSFAVGEGVSGMAAKIRHPIRINDRAKIEQVSRNTVHCILAAPIMWGTDVEGVITLTNKVKKDENGNTIIDPLSRFGEDDEQLLVSLADNAASNLNKARLYDASITDRLTKLSNSRHFEVRFGNMVTDAIAEESSLCLGILDIDHFKKFNDKYGHKAGDFVLEKTAALLRQAVRENRQDECFRYGGEEFCIVLPHTPIEEATELLIDLRKKISATTYTWNSTELSASVSIGLACSTDFSHPVSLFEAADKALYVSKDAGRNCVSHAKTSDDIVTLDLPED